MASKQSDKNDAESKVPEWADPTHQKDPAYEGNAYFARKEFTKALEAYTKSIEKHPKFATLYSNRSLVQSKLNRPLDALTDIEIGLGLEPNNEKFILRKCKLLMGLRRFTQLDEYLHESIDRLKHLASDNDFAALLDQMQRIKSEYEEGRYDLLALIEESKKSKILDKHADYFAREKLEIRAIEGKGRGFVATNKIQAGELLMACEAFVFVNYEKDIIFRASDEPYVDTPRYDAMLRKTIEKLEQRPDLAAEFYRIYAGPQLGHLENWEDGKSILIDKDRIRAILHANAFGTDNAVTDPCKGINRSPQQQSIDRQYRDSGVWMMPSYFNHTCVDGNCNRYFVGDFIFIRATRPIEKGDELVFSYVDPFKSYEQREDHLRVAYGFECQCRLCTIDRQDPIEIRREFAKIREYIDELEQRTAAVDSLPPNDVSKLRNYLKVLRNYRPQWDLNYLALRVQMVSVCTKTPDESIPFWAEMVETRKSIGELLDALHFTVPLILMARAKKRKREMNKWIKEARHIAKLLFDDERMADMLLEKEN